MNVLRFCDVVSLNQRVQLLSVFVIDEQYRGRKLLGSLGEEGCLFAVRARFCIRIERTQDCREQSAVCKILRRFVGAR